MNEPQPALLPCPFCGSHALLDAHADDCYFTLHSRLKGSGGDASLVLEAHAAWNRRTPAPVGVEPFEPAAYLHDDGYWTPAKNDEGRKLNDRLLHAGSPKIGVYLSTPTAHSALEDAARWQEHVGKLDALVAYCPTCCQGFVAQKEMTRDQIIFECGKTAGRAARKQGANHD